MAHAADLLEEMHEQFPLSEEDSEVSWDDSTTSSWHSTISLPSAPTPTSGGTPTSVSSDASSEMPGDGGWEYIYEDERTFEREVRQKT